VILPTFRFRLVPFIVTLALVAMGCGLSYWQLQRAYQKDAIEAAFIARENQPPVTLPATVDISQVEYARVDVRGEFINDWPLYLDNRPMNGKAGRVVVMPFRLQGTDQTILIARGWLPRHVSDRTRVKDYLTPAGVVHIEGIVKAHSARVLQLGDREPLRPKAIIQNLDIDAFAKASGLAVYPYIVEQTNDIHDGLMRDWPRDSMGADKHRAYAFQWLALAAMALLFFIVTSFKDGRKNHSQP
jgi:cytochrome oxidase assembly protein ShyY1